MIHQGPGPGWRRGNWHFTRGCLAVATVVFVGVRVCTLAFSRGGKGVAVLTVVVLA